MWYSIIRTTAAALALTGLAATPAHANPVRPKGAYTISVTTEAGRQDVATLTCRPTGGDHPHKRKACRQILAARGDIEAIPPADGFCTMEYAPVLVRADGTWKGNPYEYEEVFSNRCIANLETGGYVFNIGSAQTTPPGVPQTGAR